MNPDYLLGGCLKFTAQQMSMKPNWKYLLLLLQLAACGERRTAKEYGYVF
jgi:hypothetical protein